MVRERNIQACPDTDARTGPVRTCIGCRRRAAKRELLRVTAGSDPDGRPAVVPDPSATAPGRGAHLHPTPECYDLAVRRKAFARALRISAGGAGPATDAVAEHLTTCTDQARTTDRDWSSSS